MRRRGKVITIANADGSEPLDILSPATAGLAYSLLDNLQWSPDGTRLAVTVTQSADGSDTRVYVLNADGTGFRREHSSDPARPRREQRLWSPDGRSIAMQVWFNDLQPPTSRSPSPMWRPAVRGRWVQSPSTGSCRGAGPPMASRSSSCRPAAGSPSSTSRPGSRTATAGRRPRASTGNGSRQRRRSPRGVSWRHDRYRRPVRGDRRWRLGVRRRDRRRRRRADPPRRDRHDQRPRCAPGATEPTDLVRRSLISSSSASRRDRSSPASTCR